LQHRKVSRAIGGRHHDLAVDDRGACRDVLGVVGDLLEAVGPVMAAGVKIFTASLARCTWTR
jgi:hypothetical protein